MAVGPSLLVGHASDDGGWPELGAGASLELSVGAKVASTVLLGARLGSTVLPYMHGGTAPLRRGSVDFGTSLLTLGGAFIDWELKGLLDDSRPGHSLHLEAALSGAALSRGAAEGPAQHAVTSLGGAGSVGLRAELACSGRWCWGLDGRVAIAGVFAGDVLSPSGRDSNEDRREWLVVPSLMVSGVYR